MNKNIIYTYITGDYVNIIEPTIITPGWDYKCFTNNPNLKSEVWKILPIPSEYNKIKDQKRIASLLKIEYYKLIDPYYDTIISIDGNIEIKKDLNIFLEKIKFNDHDIGVLIHPERNCIYEEAKIIKINNLDKEEIVESQMKRYKNKKYPPHVGLWFGGLIIRNNKSDNIKKRCERWSQEYRNGSRRDQLSFIYSFWEPSLPIKIKYIDFIWSLGGDKDTGYEWRIESSKYTSIEPGTPDIQIIIHPHINDSTRQLR